MLLKSTFLGLLLCLGNLFSHAQTLYGLDPAFANNGIYVGDTGTYGKIVIQTDGKILALGGGKANLMRFSANGLVDNGFANGGYFSIIFPKVPYPAYPGFNCIFLQPDGKILLGGIVDTVYTDASNPNGGNYDFLLMRLNSDGSLDYSFGGGGYVVTSYHPYSPIGNSNDQIVDLALQPDGKILALGNSNTDTIMLLRYHPDGRLDSSFGVNGKSKVQPADISHPKANNVDIMLDGRIVLGAKADISALNPPWSASAFTAIRLHPDGSLDTSFNHTGIAYTNTSLNGLLYCTAMQVQRDGSILLGGHADSIAVVRFDTTGKLDHSFGVDGLIKLDPAGKMEGMTIQPDGKIVLATNPDGFPYPDTGYAIYRIMPDGKTDYSFGINGKVLTKPTYESTMIGSIALQPDGKLLAGGGYFSGNHNSKSFLVRYTSNATAVQHLDNESPIDIYPNPATDYIYLDPFTYRIQQIALYTPDGKLLITQDSPTINRLSTEGLADGIYFLHIRLAGPATLVKKIIIQHH